VNTYFSPTDITGRGMPGVIWNAASFPTAPPGVHHRAGLERLLRYCATAPARRSRSNVWRCLTPSMRIPPADRAEDGAPRGMNALIIVAEKKAARVRGLR